MNTFFVLCLGENVWWNPCWDYFMICLRRIYLGTKIVLVQVVFLFQFPKKIKS